MAERARRAGLRELYRLMSPHRRRQLAGLFALMLAGAAAELVTIGAVLPFLQLIVAPETVMRVPVLQPLMASFGWTEPADLILPATLLLIGAAVIAAAVRVLLTWVTQRFIYRLAYDFDMAIYRRTIHQPYSAYIRRNSSEVLAGLEKVNNATNFLLMPLLQAVTSGVIAVFIIALMFVIDAFTASIAALLMGTLYLAISLPSRRVLGRFTRRWALIVPARTKAVQETLGGFRDIVLDQSQDIFEARFHSLDHEFRNLSVTANFISSAPRYVVEGGGIALIGVLALYFSGQPGGVVQAVPVLGALALGAQRLLPLVQAVYLGWTQYAGNIQSLLDVIDLMKGPVTATERRIPEVAVQPFGDAISLSHVSFEYQPGLRALDDVSLVIRRGERAGFIGKTGSGKSTLVDLLMGLLEPTSGQILLGGTPLSPQNLANWQAQIAHVPQSIFLSDSSIAANIAFGEAEDRIDMDRVRAAARGADIHDFIEALPDGYLAAAGERGIRLSGGQRQRIGIARALYKRATVLILDEATSALDDATEASIMEAIDQLDRSLTIILIAHRTSTLANCDLIFRLEEGRLIESGNFAEIIAGAAPSDRSSHEGRR